RANHVVLAPAAPVGKFFGGFLDRLFADLDVHCALPSRFFLRTMPPCFAVAIMHWPPVISQADLLTEKRQATFPSALRIFPGVNGMSVSGCAPSGRNASLMA